MPLPRNETHTGLNLSKDAARNRAAKQGLDLDDLYFYKAQDTEFWGWMPLEDAETMMAADAVTDPAIAYEAEIMDDEGESPYVPHDTDDEPGPDSEADNWEQDEADAVRASADPDDDGDEGEDDMTAEAIMARNAARRSASLGHDEDEPTQQAEAVSEPEPAKPVEPLKMASVTPAPANDDDREAHPGDHIATTGPMTPAMAQSLAAEIAKRTGRTIYIRDAFSLEVKGSVEPRLKLVGGHGLSDQQITLIELCSRQDENGNYIGATGQELLEAGAAEKPKKGGQSINWRAKALACEKRGYDFDLNPRRVPGTTRFEYLYILRPRKAQAAG